MNVLTYLHSILLSVLIAGMSTSYGEELLLHSGPPVSTPASTPVSPFPETTPPKLLNFQREFYVDRALFASLPEPSSTYSTVPVSAAKAIDLAMKDVDPNNALRTLIVTELRLLKGPEKEKRQVEYYLISMLANGSEEHRIVLMNSRVITSKLKQIKEQ
ncbi:MAG: hypothetical protein ABIS50_10305 [Luteolibacter sp.]|uniref:hypothetical protein n=1 Tax=Luteolibacter sp. TaxID=1962973 RepID=UPI003263FB3B